MRQVKARLDAFGKLAGMPQAPALSGTARRHPWPRILVRLRRTWFGITETLSFFAAAAVAVGRFLLGR